MRTITYLSVLMYLLLNPKLIFSQDYIKFPEEGSVWHIKSISCGDQQCQNYDMYLEYTGDTIINGIKQSIIGDFFVVDTNKIVYATNFDDYFIEYDDSVVLYDFNLTQDDTFRVYHTNYDTIYFVVDEIDSVLINDKYRTRIKLDPKNTKVDFLDTLIWVEGIGSNVDPIYIPSLPYHEYNQYLYCYKLNNEKYFGECVTVDVSHKKAPLKTALIYPNPVSDYSILNPGTKKEYILEICSSSGILQKKEKITGKYTIRRSDFNQGFYKYRIIYMGTFYTGSFVIL